MLHLQSAWRLMCLVQFHILFLIVVKMSSTFVCAPMSLNPWSNPLVRVSIIVRYSEHISFHVMLYSSFLSAIDPKLLDAPQQTRKYGSGASTTKQKSSYLHKTAAPDIDTILDDIDEANTAQPYEIDADEQSNKLPSVD